MINHVRTLLLNVKSEIDPNIVGEEYIPPAFLPTVFDTQVSKIYNVLFGGSPDRYMLNYRGQQIMTMLHSTELAQNVLDYDSRITYWPRTGTTFYDFPFVTAAEKIGNFTGDIHFINELKPSDATGQMYHMWRIYVKDSATITVTHLNDPKEEQEYSYVITEGRSDSITLLGSTQYFSFNAPVGSSWTVKGFAKPVRDMGDIFSTLKQSVTIIDELALWGAAPVEPLLTYKNLWRDHDEYAYSLGGLVMALVAKNKRFTYKGRLIMEIPHTSNSIKMWAVIDNVEVEITKATVSYEMNTIPVGTILCPVGINEENEVAKSHELLKKKWPQPVQLMVEVKQISGEKRKHLPEGKYVIFDGYVGGAAVKRSLNGFTISFELTHWLSDLNHGSAMSAGSHPDNPTRFSFSSTFKMTSGGGAGGTEHWTPETLAMSAFNKGDVQEDLWEKCILKWFTALAKEDRLGVQGGEGCTVGPNDSKEAVQTALGRFENGDPPLKFLEGYKEGIHQIWDEFSFATFNATHNANSLAGVSHSTIWDKLINSFAANFNFSIIPFPEKAKVVPFCPLMTDHWKVARSGSEYTIQSNEIDYLDFAQKVIRPIKGYMLYGDIGFLAGANAAGGQMKDTTDTFLGGCYVPDQDGPGMIIIKKLPRYLSNVVQANRKVKAATNVKSTQVHSEETGDITDDSKDRKKKVLTHANDLAKFLYHNENLKSRHGQLSGPLRFDICPGSTVKIEGVGHEIYKALGADITDAYAHVLRITHYIDAETPRAGTAFHLSHIHSKEEHGEHSVDKHPLYAEKWNSKDCEGTAAPNGNEFSCA